MTFFLFFDILYIVMNSKRPAYEGVDMIKKKQVKHFDFAKRPNNPCFLMSVAKNVISFPDLKKRKFKLTKINMEKIEGPYLLLVTHSSYPSGCQQALFHHPCQYLP